jgi:hypothetical protein
MNIYRDLTEYINKESGKTAYVCALGPSLKPYINSLKNDESSFIISCNEVDTMTQLIPKYWVLSQRNELNIINMSERIKKYPETIIVHGDSMDETPRSWILENVINTYVGFDQRHFESKRCPHSSNCCGNLIENRKTIQEILKELSGYDKLFGTGHTVSIFMIALAVILGAKKIYIFGMELNYSVGYVDGVTTNHHDFGPYIREILEDVDTIYQSAKLLGAEIINMSENSPLKQVLPTSNTI